MENYCTNFVPSGHIVYKGLIRRAEFDQGRSFFVLTFIYFGRLSEGRSFTLLRDYNMWVLTFFWFTKCRRKINVASKHSLINRLNVFFAASRSQKLGCNQTHFLAFKSTIVFVFFRAAHCFIDMRWFSNSMLRFLELSQLTFAYIRELLIYLSYH